MSNLRKTRTVCVTLLEVESTDFLQASFHAFKQWRTVARCALVALCAAMASLTAIAVAQDDPVDSGRDALGRTGNLPWYDAEADEIRPAKVRSPNDPPSRPDVEGQRLSQPSRGGSGMFGDFTTLGLIVRYIGLGLIAVLILFVIVLGIRSLVGRGGIADMELAESSRRIISDADRMEQLPIPLKRDLSDLLGEARRQYEQGNYNEAIIYLYSYLLVELDRSQRIRLLRGKTNRQYLRELRDSPLALSSLVERTMVAFEDVFFGDRKLERARFEACYNHLSEFQQHVEPATA